MPLHQTIQHDAKTQILVWNITESLIDLFDSANVTDQSLFRIGNMKSESHKRGFLAVRMLLQHAGYTDHDLYYDAFGKPHLRDGTHISISHSHEFSAVILSDKITGLDLELRREKIALIADKFIEPSFVLDKTAPDYINKLTVNWGVKEAVFKVCNEKGISFKDHINVEPFDMADRKTTAHLHFKDVKRQFSVFFEEIGDYSLVYLFEV
ncbi:4'-phosphopantetheinyl transferase domain-containing protein [Flavobacterium longum]|uniref:4-phosphopantetheinyl transferase n=1 Tax=Flavobacterium longum TaxID=1299340 RepID=UPI0039EB33D2